MCERNICTPCYKTWQASETAKFYSTPCKCPKADLKQGINKLKHQLLSDVRFKCNNARCQYELTYDELLLGTHELDECQFMHVVCEGCGMRIVKQE